MPFGLVIGAGLGLLKSELVDQPAEQRQRNLAAVTAKFAPWTGMTPQVPKATDPIGTALQFGGAGAGLAQNMANANANTNYMNAKTANGSFSGVPALNFTTGNGLSNGPWSITGPNPFSSN
jgi:hypothetical protein